MPKTTETAVTHTGSQYQTTIPQQYGEAMSLDGRYLDWTVESATAFLLLVRDENGPARTAVNRRSNGQYGTTVPKPFATGADRGRGLQRVEWALAGSEQLEVRKVA